jgi:ubiquinone/menaquinone biosynthesis C-methylase UbiE
MSGVKRMSWWEHRVLPRVVDVLLSSRELRDRRVRACSGLQGHVVEIGFGSGLNTPYYPAEVSRVSAVEPNDAAWRLAQDRIGRSTHDVRRVGLDGERLPLPDGAADHVLLTFVMCTIPDVRSAVAEIRRVLRPGGEAHFLEHGRSPDPGVARWQRRLDPVQRRVGGGCHLTRDPVRLLADAGLEIVQDERGYLRGPRITRPGTYLYQGRARR